MSEVALTKGEWELAKARIGALPSNIRISVGGVGGLTREDLLTHIEKQDDLGKLLASIQLNYVRSFRQEAAVIHG